jgi:arylsulfatase A-like enzyme
MTSASRNVVLLTVDCLRADHCGFMNSAMDTTPFLDRMAADSVVFENAIAPGPRTPSSIPEIVTGEPLPKYEMDDQDWREAMMQSVAEHVGDYETIAERFAERGYSTAAYTANPWTLRETNFDAGFDHFQEVGSGSSGLLERMLSDTRAGPIARLADQWWQKNAWFSQWRTFYTDLTTTIEQLSEPYFVWVFLLDAHNPYIAPRQDRRESNAFGTYYSTLRGNAVMGDDGGKSNFRENLPPSIEYRIKEAYRDTIRSVDRFVSTLWNDHGDDDPIVAVHADHGEAFNEHDTYGHQRRLYEENIHVPLLIYNTDATGRIREPVSLRRLPEILMASAGEETNPARWSSEYVCSRTDDDGSMAVRGERWKYIASSEGEELYDLSMDVKEQRNVIDSYSDVAEQLRAVLASFMDKLPEKVFGDQDKAVDQGVEERLESLGYK